MSRKQRKPGQQHAAARQEIAELFSHAANAATQKLADRYVKLAREIGMRFRLPLSSPQKRRFCKNCGSFLRSGVNCRVRVRDGKIRYTCLRCKHPQRLPYRPRRRLRNL